MGERAPALRFRLPTRPPPRPCPSSLAASTHLGDINDAFPGDRVGQGERGEPGGQRLGDGLEREGENFEGEGHGVCGEGGRGRRVGSTKRGRGRGVCVGFVTHARRGSGPAGAHTHELCRHPSPQLRIRIRSWRAEADSTRGRGQPARRRKKKPMPATRAEKKKRSAALVVCVCPRIARPNQQERGDERLRWLVVSGLVCGRAKGARARAAAGASPQTTTKWGAFRSKLLSREKTSRLPFFHSLSLRRRASHTHTYTHTRTG